MEKLSKAQRRILHAMLEGGTARQGATKEGTMSIFVAGKRVGTRMSLDILLDKGLIAQVGQWQWIIVHRGRDYFRREEREAKPPRSKKRQ